MTRYRGPKTFTEGAYQGKFVRVGEQVAIAPDKDFKMTHRDIAEKDRLLSGLHALVTESPAEADAGLLYVSRGFGERPGTIRVLHHSTTLGLPVVDEARTRSGVVFEQLSPGYEVEVEVPPAKESR